MQQTLKVHGIVRAAISHLWFITIHPFDDGNDRVTRALIIEHSHNNEQISIRFFSLSAAIEKNRTAYYEILEKMQNCKTQIQQTSVCETDITEWLNWFLDALAQAIKTIFR